MQECHKLKSANKELIEQIGCIEQEFTFFNDQKDDKEYIAKKNAILINGENEMKSEEIVVWVMFINLMSLDVCTSLVSS